MAEWSKALVLGTSLSGGVGSNPTTITSFYDLYTSENNILKTLQISFMDEAVAEVLTKGALFEYRTLGMWTW